MSGRPSSDSRVHPAGPANPISRLGDGVTSGRPTVDVGVLLAVGSRVGKGVGTWVGVAVDCRVGEGVDSCVGVAVGGVVGVGVASWIGTDVSAGVCAGVCVGITAGTGVVVPSDVAVGAGPSPQAFSMLITSSHPKKGSKLV